MSDKDKIARLFGFLSWDDYMEWWHHEMERHARGTGPKIIVSTRP